MSAFSHFSFSMSASVFSPLSFYLYSFLFCSLSLLCPSLCRPSTCPSVCLRPCSLLCPSVCLPTSSLYCTTLCLPYTVLYSDNNKYFIFLSFFPVSISLFYRFSIPSFLCLLVPTGKSSMRLPTSRNHNLVCWIKMYFTTESRTSGVKYILRLPGRKSALPPKPEH